MASVDRKPVGVWTEWRKGARWSNEGMTRLLGFLIEGAAAKGDYIFKVVVPDDMRDEAEEDLRDLNAEIGRDFSVHSPSDVAEEATSFDELAIFANRHVQVDGWLSLFPSFKDGAALDAPVAVIFPDAIPKVFPEFGDATWGEEGRHLEWERDVRTLLERADRVLTFSGHVAEKHVCQIFGFDRDRTVRISHASPDLKPLLPFVDARRRTAESRGQAADLLRAEFRRRDDRYLADYPFEEVDFVAVSTQDRVTKNIQLAARAVMTLVRERRYNLKLLTTAPLHFDQHWTILPRVIEDAQAVTDVVAVPDLPRREHAALLHCAALVVHPSIFEGGHAPFPFYEAVSIGTPALMANGPHLEELAQTEPDIRRYCFAWDDQDGLADMIVATLADRERTVARQQEIYGRLAKTSWADVAQAYAQAAIDAR